MDEIYEYNGKQYTLAQLQSKYGDKTQDAISKLGFKRVDSAPKEETYTYKDKTFTRKDLEAKYGDKTDEAINKFGFESSVKKKDIPDSTSPDPNLASETKKEDGFSDSTQKQYENKPILDEKGEQVYYTDKKTGELKPATQKVEKGYASQSEYDRAKKAEVFKPIVTSSDVKKFQENVNLTKEDEAKLDAIVYDEENISTWDKFKNSAWNAVKGMSGLPSSVTDSKIIPFENEIKEVKKEALSKKEKLSEEEIYNKAKQSYRQKEADKIYNDKANRYLQDLDPETKHNVEKEIFETGQQLSERNKSRLKTNTILKASIEEKASRLEQLNNIPKEEITEADVYQFNSLRDELNKDISQIKSNEDSFLKDQDDLMSAEKEFDLVKREYAFWNNFNKNAAASTADVLGGLADFANYGMAINASAKFGTPLAAPQIDTKEWKEQSRKVREEIRKPIESIESVSGFVDYMSDLVANQLPILTATSMGYGGLGVIGASSTGQKYAEMQDENNNSIKPANYSPLQMTLVPLAYGGAEVISEIPTLSIINKGKRVLNSALNESPTLFKKSASKIATEWVKDYTGDTSKEIIGEEFTGLIQDTLDKYGLGKDVEIGGNAYAIFKDSFALTTLMKVSPHIVGATLKPFQKGNDFDKLELNAKQILLLNNQLNVENITNTEKQVITSQIDKLTSDSGKIMDNTISKVGDMPNELIDEVKRLNNEAGKLKAQAEDIYVNGKLDNKNELIKSLESQYQAIQEQRNNVLDGKTSVVDVLPLEQQDKLKKQALNELTQELNPDGKKDMTIDDAQITERANENYLKDKDAKSETPTTETKEQPLEEATPKSTEEQKSFAERLGETEDIGDIVQGATKTKVGDSDIVLKENGDTIKLESISTPTDKRGQGSAKKALNQLTTLADAQGKTLELNVVPLDETTNPEKLVQLYESLGFTKEENFDIDGGKMTRIPNEKTSTTNTETNGDIPVGTIPNQQQGKDNDVQATVEPTRSKKEIEIERDTEIAKLEKPTIKLSLASSMDLVNSKDPIGNKQKHNDIKDRYKKLKALTDCL